MIRFLLLATLFTFSSATDVHLFGDSTTGNMKLCQNFKLFEHPYNVIDHSRSSQKINGVQQQLFQIINQKPDIIVITVGYKDMIFDRENTPVSYHLNKYRNMLDLLRELYPNAIVLINSILPAGSPLFGDDYTRDFLKYLNSFNQGLNEIVQRFPSTYRFVNVFPLFTKDDLVNDSLFLLENDLWVHPNCQGYNLWKSEIHRVFRQYIENKPKIERNPEKLEHKSLSSSPQTSNSVSGSISTSISNSVSTSISNSENSVSGSVMPTLTSTPTPIPPIPTLNIFSPSVSVTPSPSASPSISATTSPSYNLTVSASPSVSEPSLEVLVVSSATKNVFSWSILLITLFLF